VTVYAMTGRMAGVCHSGPSVGVRRNCCRHAGQSRPALAAAKGATPGTARGKPVPGAVMAGRCRPDRQSRRAGGKCATGAAQDVPTCRPPRPGAPPILPVASGGWPRGKPGGGARAGAEGSRAEGRPMGGHQPSRREGTGAAPGVRPAAGPPPVWGRRQGTRPCRAAATPAWKRDSAPSSRIRSATCRRNVRTDVRTLRAAISSVAWELRLTATLRNVSDRSG